MLTLKDALIYISQAPFRFLSLSLIIILFIIIIVIGNSLFNSAYQELEIQIQQFLPGSLLIKNNSTQSDVLRLAESTNTAAQILPESGRIMEYTKAHPAVSAIVPFKLAQVRLDTKSYSLYDLHTLCLHTDAAAHLKDQLIIEQGDFLSLDQRGIMVSQALIDRLYRTFNIQFKVGDMLTLSNALLAFGFSQYRVPLKAVYSLKHSKSEFNFISSLILIDEISFNLLFNLAIAQENIDALGQNLLLKDAHDIFNNHVSLFVLPDLSHSDHSLASLFSLLGDPKQKYAVLTPQTQIWQGILLNLPKHSAQDISVLSHNIEIFFSTHNIPARVSAWPGKSMPVLNKLELKHTVFIIIMIFFALLIIVGSNIISRPTYKQSQLIKKNRADISLGSSVYLLFGLAVLQSVLCGILGVFAAGIVFIFFWGRALYFSPDSWFFTLFESPKLYPELHISGFLYVMLFLFLYSCFSWIHAITGTRK